MKSFNYITSKKIIYWGSSFDSILELKYAISISPDYEFLRSHIPIYYDRRTKLPVSYIRGNTRRYTPDFLVRHKITGEAFLVEIKPRSFQGNDQLSLRKEVAENYIRWKNYDWKFKVIFSDEIKLTADQYERFIQCCKLVELTKKKLHFRELNNKYDRSKPTLFSSPPSPGIFSSSCSAVKIIL